MERSILLLMLFVAVSFVSKGQQVNPERQWPMYRGNFASGILNNANLPEKWDASTGENIAWKTPIPGIGNSCPVVWGNNIFITTAISQADSGKIVTGIYGSIQPVKDSSAHEWKIYCIDKETGAVKWQQTAHKGIPSQKRHPMSSHANCTPTTNGEYVVAFFGSEGLYCYTTDGRLKWKKDFGNLKASFFMIENAEWEFASSPLVYNNTVIVQCDIFKNSFIAAFDLKTGEQLWRTERDEYPGWCTPNLYINNGKPVVVVNGFKHRGGYDFKTGAEIWKMSGGGDIPIPTPIIGDSLLFFNSAHGKTSPVMAISTRAKGDITLAENQQSNDYVKWYKPRGGSYMGTMLLYNGNLYNAGWNGNLTCYNATTGEQLYSQKVGNGNSYTSSPVASDGVLYFADNNGVVYSVKAGPQYQLLGQNTLNETLMTTPAISDNYLFFRTANHLVAVSNLKK